ncbi:MAG: hypothetical protein KJ659_09270 [Actinobacteria bacterium]|nr:hypothetical protein [Actinomycetota bacterium]MBU1609687.1 hypothetical protein [Actinomycetota bacterium]MBU2316192.1 hypothetical protein [Actinomycetota bacterium]MBU2385668.1 hypothetical protein [Actinomycetota bacterium]
MLLNTAVEDLLVDGEDLFTTFGAVWSVQVPAEQLPEAAELATVYDDSRGAAIEQVGQECADGVLDGLDGLLTYAEAASISFYDNEEGQLSSVAIYKMADPSSATEAVDGLRSGFDVCAEVAERTPNLDVSDEVSSFEDAALQNFSFGSDSQESVVYVQRGSFVIAAMTRVSVALTDELAQAQLNKLDVLAAEE